MKQNFFYLIYSLILVGWIITPITSLAATGESCSGNVCTAYINSLPEGSTGLNPNTLVTINFSVYQKPSGAPPACSKTIFYAVRHYINGGSTYDYPRSGTGTAVDYQFNSLTAGNKNKYSGVFYCWSQQVSGDQVDSLIAQIGAGAVWLTPIFDMTTRTANSTATVSISPNGGAVAKDSTITVTGTNLPSGSKMAVTVGSKTLESTTGSVSLTMSEASGFSLTQGGSVSVKVFDSNGNELTNLSVSKTFSISSGSQGAGGTVTGNNGAQTGPALDCSDPANSGNQNCLYNPLPTGNLTNMFLFIAKGFLSILGIWAVIFIIVGGFRMVMAQGNEESYTQAKRTITWAILGLVLAVLSFSIVAIVQNLLQANIKGPG